MAAAYGNDANWLKRIRNSVPPAEGSARLLILVKYFLLILVYHFLVLFNDRIVPALVRLLLLFFGRLAPAQQRD
ncbi:MAG: hypothetical protein WBN22_05695 [Verrucomicrobiia bacterium]